MSKQVGQGIWHRQMHILHDNGVMSLGVLSILALPQDRTLHRIFGPSAMQLPQDTAGTF
jgi:hypothetical protein